MKPILQQLSPQYLHPPGDLSFETNLTKEVEYRSRTLRPQDHPPNILYGIKTGDLLSPQYLHPPNPSSKLENSSKESTPRYAPGRNHQADKDLSPQYLFPPNFWNAAPERPFTISTALEKVERERNLGEQNLSPQYLFPPNIRNPSLPPEPITENHWGVIAPSTRQRNSKIANQWRIISLFVRLRYSQRPPFIVPSRSLRGGS